MLTKDFLHTQWIMNPALRHLQHNTSQRKIQIPQSSHGCKIQPGCIPNEDGPDPRGTKGSYCNSWWYNHFWWKMMMTMTGTSLPWWKEPNKLDWPSTARNVSYDRNQSHFFGVVFGKDGMSPDPKKIQGILEMPPSKGHNTTTNLS